FLKAAEIAKAIGSSERLARAALEFAGLNVVRTAGGLQQVQLLEDALALAPDGDDALKARLLARLAVDCRVVPNTTRRIAALSDEAIAMARRLSDPAVLAFVLLARHVAVWGPDNLEERLALTTEALRAAEVAGDLYHQIWSHFFRENVLYEIGDIKAL